MRSPRPDTTDGSRSPFRGGLRTGISRLELLVAGLVCGLLLIHVERALIASRERSRRQTCADHLRQLHLGLMSYHDCFRALPPAGIWQARPEDDPELLPVSDDPAAISFQNWLLLLLPHVDASSPADRGDPAAAIGAPTNATLRTTRLDLAVCPSDAHHTDDRRYLAHSAAYGDVGFAHGNYAINGGTQHIARFPGSSADPAPGGVHLEVDHATHSVRFWGNGVAGFNRSFSLDEFTNGQGSLVAIDEVRAGIHPRDPRGVWALGQIGSSVTWAHGVNGDAAGPNSDAMRADDVAGCVELHAALGAERLAEAGMPCCEYCLHNEQAGARSDHPGGVHALTLDGAVHFIANEVDPGMWHVLHSRESPADRLKAWSQETHTLHRRTLSDTGPQPAEWGDPAPGAVALTNSIGMAFVRLPPGRFVMGLPDEEINVVLVQNKAARARDVELTHPVWMGVYEVTRAEFTAAGPNGPDEGTAFEGDRRLPQSNVTWDEAAEFCARLSALPEEVAAGRCYRLPTEAEWEYACRAGSTQPHIHIPERQPGDVSGENAMKSPPLPIAAVGSYAPNAFGLHDMRGNVWEWCADWAQPDYDLHSPEQDPQGPPRGYLKVVRGSDWRYVGQRCALSFRATEPWLRSPFVGFRVVCEALAAQQ